MTDNHPRRYLAGLTIISAARMAENGAPTPFAYPYWLHIRALGGQQGDIIPVGSLQNVMRVITNVVQALSQPGEGRTVAEAFKALNLEVSLARGEDREAILEALSASFDAGQVDRPTVLH